MNLKDKYKDLVNNNSAIFAANFYNFETLKGLIEAAKELDTGLILQASVSTLNYLGIQTTVALAKSMLEENNVTGWVHLDHGDSIEIVGKCIDAGFDSVMIDGSELPFEKNINLTKQVVEIAMEKDIPVEAELGYIAKLGQSQLKEKNFTRKEEAKIFVEETGVDALAIAIGTAHGFYVDTPEINFKRLAEIRNALPDTALVLHGSSGIPHDDLKKAIELGINKINVATEFKNTFMKSLKNEISKTDNIDLRQVFPAAINEVKNLAISKFGILTKTEPI